MNRDRIEGRWKQVIGTLMEQWGQLTGNREHVAAGRRERCFGGLQERYGASIELAARELRAFRARNRDWNISLR